jgi:PAS domain S-box-containing protein
MCAYPTGVQILFPDDILLKQMQIEGYVGYPLFDTKRKPIGIIVLLSNNPIENLELTTTLLKIFSGRCGVEIERMRFERAYQESELKYRTLVECIKDGIFILREAKLEYVNPAFYEMLGYEPGELNNFYFPDFITLEDKDRILDYYNRRLKGDPSVPTTYSVNLVKKNGSFVKVIINALLADFRGSKFVIGTATDITEQYNLEKEKFELERQLLQTQKLESIGVLTGGIAHNFNNLLMAIIGNLDLAMLRMIDMNTDISLLNNAMDGARRAADLTSKMLTYSGKGILNLHSINLNESITANYNLFRSSINSLIEIKFECDDNLPDIKADSDQINQILMNLIINSSEAIGDNPGLITIKSGIMNCNKEYLEKTKLDIVQAPGKYIFIEVTDTGCGMNNEILERIFDPFYSTKFLGRGLGMPAVMGIIKVHKGAIIVDSIVDSGTTIRVLFPYQTEVIVDFPSVINDASTSNNAEIVQCDTILIADDDINIRNICKEILETIGYKTLIAENGSEAVELYKQNRNNVCCVLLDLTMPIMDGVEALREIRIINNNAVVILSSGYNESEALRRLKNDKPTGFIQKPYTVNGLDRIINRVMGISVN